jgi:hypothetical protein
MLEKERNNIDAVTVSTPDHTHAAAAMMALKMGKHVYCQKPLARTIGEVRALKAEAAKRPRQATQMGNQGHALEGIRSSASGSRPGSSARWSAWSTGPTVPIWPQAINRPTDAHNAAPPSTGTSGSVPPRSGRSIRATRRSTGAAGGTSAPARWGTWRATSWMRRTGRSGSSIRRASSPESTTLYTETAPAAERITYEFPAIGDRPAVTLVWRDGSFNPPKPAGWPETLNWPYDATGAALGRRQGDDRRRHLRREPSAAWTTRRTRS